MICGDRIKKYLFLEKRQKAKGQYNQIQPLRVVVVVVIIEVPAVENCGREEAICSVETTIKRLKIEK